MSETQRHFTRMDMLELQRGAGNTLAGRTDSELAELLQCCSSEHSPYARTIREEQERRIRTQEPALPWERPRRYAADHMPANPSCPHCGK
jgi:hypothetical protein